MASGGLFFLFFVLFFFVLVFVEVLVGVEVVFELVLDAGLDLVGLFFGIDDLLLEFYVNSDVTELRVDQLEELVDVVA